MASLIAGFEYDIFISYRQKDNKHHGWVTEFVSNLKGELESTFKEEISVYFDINPHDGLLETHDVDASLKDKLKCLVFIPIISRTYCDPKSFAWEHEFKAFVEMASKDQFGLKIKLPGGNVANRILPIQIYDLETDDIKLFESILGSVLRGVEFIYKSAGVNRPLRSMEEKPQDNLNNTLYRDQINKVANAIRGIISGLNPEADRQIDQEKLQSSEKKRNDGSVEDLSDPQFTDRNHVISIFRKLVPRNKLTIPLILFGFLSGIMALFILFGYFSNDSDKFATYSTIPAESFLMDGLGQFPQFAISPDGRTIASCSAKGISLRYLSGFSAKLLEGTEGADQFIFSPDGQVIMYETLKGIYKIGISGSPVSLVYSSRLYGPMSWGIDGYIYFCPEVGSAGIWRISANGGEPEQLTSVIDSLGENAQMGPQLLPDSRTLLFTSLGPSGGSLDSRVVVQQIDSKERKVLVDKAMFGYYLSNGDLLYTNNEGNIFVVGFDLHKLKIIGEPAAVLSGVNTSTWGGTAFLSVSGTGNLIYLPRNPVPLNNLDILDRSGKMIEKNSVSQKTLEIMGYGWGMTSISPSGKLIACAGRSYGSSDIWIVNLEKDEAERITFDPAEEEFPVWSPDGKTIAYTKALTGTVRQVLIKDPGPAGNPHLIRTWPRHIHLTSWSPDRKWIVGHDFNSANGQDCYAFSLDSGDYISIANSRANESNGQFSPDGKWLAFQSDESGRDEIYVVSFPKLASKRQISTDGGIFPRWDHCGKFIYYLSDDFMISQEVDTDGEFKKGKSEKLFRANDPDKPFLIYAIGFNVSPDGQKFYLIRKNVKRANEPLNLIINWFQELKVQTGK